MAGSKRKRTRDTLMGTFCGVKTSLPMKFKGVQYQIIEQFGRAPRESSL